MSFPRTLPLPCSLLLRSIPGPSLSSNLYVSLKFKFKLKQLHWHDKRGSRLGSFSKSAPSHSYAPCPSNLWSGLEYGLCDVEEGQLTLVCWVRSVDSHTMSMSASLSCEGQLWQGFCLELHRLPLSFDPGALLLVLVTCVCQKAHIWRQNVFHSCLCIMCK